VAAATASTPATAGANIYSSCPTRPNITAHRGSAAPALAAATAEGTTADVESDVTAAAAAAAAVEAGVGVSVTQARNARSIAACEARAKAVI
jgi:hypothetical protein